MFRNLLEEKLEHEGKDYVLIGESHTSASSALHALHSCENAISKTSAQGKQIIFLTEDLNALKNEATHADEPYTREHINAADLSQKDQMQLIKLIEDGVKIYGLEDGYTNPFILFEYKEGLNLTVAQQDLIALCNEFSKTMPEFKEFINVRLPKILAFIDDDLDRDNYERLLSEAKTAFNKSDLRIIHLNTVTLTKMRTLTQGQNNVLCTVGVGVAHIGTVADKSSGAILEPGLLERTLKTIPHAEQSVSACYVTNQEDLSAQKTYTPIQWNPRVTFGNVEPVLLFKSTPMPNSLFTEKNRQHIAPTPPKKDDPKGSCTIS